MADEKILVDPRALADYAAALLRSRDIDPRDAALMADSLLFADLRGIDTHGVMRLPVYLQRIDRGLLSRENRVAVVREDARHALIDGGNYLGPVAATLAMQKAVEKAREGLVGVGLVRNNHHYGACAQYAMMGLEEGMLAFTCSNTMPLMAPTGGKTRLVGNNPFAFAAPCGEYPPFVLDLAMSVVAGGKIILAEKNGERIPTGWALDREGRPTTDPRAGFAEGGLLLPIGGHKGYGIALMLDILAGVLTGSAFGGGVGSLGDFARRDPMGTGHLMLALNIGGVMEPGRFRARMDALVRELKAAPRAEGCQEILIPGELEHRTARRRRKEGIPLSPAVLAELEREGVRAGLGAVARLPSSG